MQLYASMLLLICDVCYDGYMIFVILICYYYILYLFIYMYGILCIYVFIHLTYFRDKAGAPPSLGDSLKQRAAVGGRYAAQLRIVESSYVTHAI